MTGQLALPLHDLCQRWRERRPSYVLRQHGGFSRADYTVAPVPTPAAKSFVELHHYAGSFPAARWSLGMWRGDQLVGVAVFGIPTSHRVLTLPFPDLEPLTQAIELSRFVLLQEVPGNAETYFLARARGWLRAETEIRAVVAFSDPVPRVVDGVTTMPGHIGGIYIASSSRYLGRATPRTLTMLPDGSILNDRTRSKIRNRERGWRYGVGRLVDLGATPPDGDDLRAWLPGALTEVGATSRRHGGVLRYAFPLDRHVRLGPPVQPPPVRV
jgi:hypothetical protein